MALILLCIEIEYYELYERAFKELEAGKVGRSFLRVQSIKKSSVLYLKLLQHYMSQQRSVAAYAVASVCRQGNEFLRQKCLLKLNFGNPVEAWQIATRLPEGDPVRQRVAQEYVMYKVLVAIFKRPQLALPPLEDEVSKDLQSCIENFLSKVDYSSFSEMLLAYKAFRTHHPKHPFSKKALVIIRLGELGGYRWRKWLIFVFLTPVLLLLIFVCYKLFSTARRPSADYSYLMKWATEALREGNKQRAKALLNTLVKMDPLNKEARNLLKQLED